jgi:site-specific DNA-methyltransferase (adenine-specific)
VLFLGNNIEILKTLEENSVDSVVTDPPYGLKFMNKQWDYNVPSVFFWREVFRVLKPGGHVLSFGGTRTYHKLVTAIEDAGFEIRDQIQWLYGSGFPKSYNISKGIDKAEKSGSEKWDGFGTALKPANEPIVLARKPLSEKNIVDNVLKWGTGGLNIDGCWVGTDEKLSSGRHTTGDQKGPSGYKTTNRTEYEQNSQGRFPANIILDEIAAEMLDEQSGPCKTGDLNGQPRVENKIYGKAGSTIGTPRFYKSDAATGASRFFYVAKASKSERNAGLEGMPANHHPTVKPIKLMQYLTRLITPPQGIVLDPFMGSGSTGVACNKEGFSFVGIEISEEYFEIAKKRVYSED